MPMRQDYIVTRYNLASQAEKPRAYDGLSIYDTYKREHGGKDVTKETGNCSSLAEERKGKEKVLVLATVALPLLPTFTEHRV